MSDSSHSLPPKPSLEQLRKQAKELAKSASLPLMQAQRELAKRYGFGDWAALAAHVAAVNPAGLKRYEELARALATGYAAGDVQAVRQINWTYGTSFVWDKDAELMRRRLPTWFASAERDPDLALADARHLVARSVGFDDWPTLTRSLAAAPAARPSSGEPQPYRFDAATNTINVSSRLAEAHSDAVIAAMKERGITGVNAPGITDAARKRVSRIDGLRRLSVGGAVTNAGIRHLDNAGMLEDLELNGAHRVSDGGLAVPAAFPDVLGARRLGRRRREPRVLRRARGGRPRSLRRPCDAAHRSLKGLGVSLKRVDDNALSALPSFPALRQLMPMDVTDDGFRWVGQCTQLENLWCMYCRSTGDEATEHLCGLNVLRSYYAGSTQITDRSLEVLARLLALEKIELYDVQGITDAGVAALARLPRLTELSIDGSPRVTRAAVTAFGRHVTTSYS